jgi:hypothetical protein
MCRRQGHRFGKSRENTFHAEGPAIERVPEVENGLAGVRNTRRYRRQELGG